MTTCTYTVAMRAPRGKHWRDAGHLVRAVKPCALGYELVLDKQAVKAARKANTIQDYTFEITPIHHTAARFPERCYVTVTSWGHEGVIVVKVRRA